MKSIIHITSLLLFILSSCSKNSGSPSPSGSNSSTGIAGSLARFAIVNDHLYTVTSNEIIVMDISKPENPTEIGKKHIGFNIETIFPFNHTLFIGSQNGMFIYDVSKPAYPEFQSNYSHITSCDPVVANNEYAFVTLRNGTQCSRGLNQLDIIDIKNIKQPKTIQSYLMMNPKGLAIDGNNLFICDNVVKWYDISDIPNLKLLHTIDIRTHDAIATNGTLMLVGEDGLSQYNYTGSTPQFLSKINTK